MSGAFIVSVYDLATDELSIFMGVPAVWAVRYCFAAKHNRLPELYLLRDNDASEHKVNARFPVVRGPRTVACGDFVARAEEDK